MDRASDSGSEGWGFESLPVYQRPEGKRLWGFCILQRICLLEELLLNSSKSDLYCPISEKAAEPACAAFPPFGERVTLRIRHPVTE